MTAKGEERNPDRCLWTGGAGGTLALIRARVLRVAALFWWALVNGGYGRAGYGTSVLGALISVLQLVLFERLLGGAVQDASVDVETRAVARAIPAPLDGIERYLAALVGADG